MPDRPAASIAHNLPYHIIFLGIFLLFGGLAIVKILPIAAALGFVLGPIFVVLGIVWALFRDWKKRPTAMLNKIQALWAMQYSIDHPTIDSQHRELFNRIENLFKSIGDTTRADYFQETYKFLMEYVDFHFKDEESLMAEVNYPDRENHIKLHEQFREQVAQFSGQHKDFKEPEGQQAFVEMVSNWLVNHILIEDKKIGKFVKSAA